MSGVYMLGGQPFRSKNTIKQYIRGFIAAQPLGETVADSILTELLQKHPNWDEKSRGMERLAIGEVKVPHASTKCKTVVIERPDATVDITWSRLVDRLQHDGSLRHVDDRSENLVKIKTAARAAIQYQILKVSKDPGEHIDHIFPRTFDRLLFLFLKWWGVPVASIKIDDPIGNVIGLRFNCWDLETNWQMFHERVARLRAVPPAVNMAARVYPVNWSELP